MITFSCPSCAMKLSVKDEFAGKSCSCPSCKKKMVVPKSAQATLSEAVPQGATATSHPAAGAASSEDYDFLAPAQAKDELGRLGPYRVLKILGTGGMGVVFLAEDPALKRQVALKAMKPGTTSPSAKQRFMREAQTTAGLRHDHIVTIFQVGEDRGAPFLAMEYLVGEALDARIKREGKLPIAEVLRIGRETAEGLAAAHEKGLIHRDIKPANIWLETRRPVSRDAKSSERSARPNAKSSERSADFRVKILDFGLARGSAEETQLTQSGAIVGTPAFMAPEQASGEKVDHRCDLFSLGCVLYRLCTGELPFKGANTMMIILALSQDQPKSPREINPQVPQAVSDLIMKLLEKKREQRVQTAQAVVEAIVAIEETETALLPTQPTLLKGTAGGQATSERRLRGMARAAAILTWSAGLLFQGMSKTASAAWTWSAGSRLRRSAVVAAPLLALLLLWAAVKFHSRSEPSTAKASKADPGVGKDKEQNALPAEADAKLDADMEKWVKEVSEQPPRLQVTSVKEKLKELNPGPRPVGVDFEVDGAEVTSLGLHGDLKNISPVRALTKLKRLSFHRYTVMFSSNRGGGGVPVLSDIMPLKGMPLTSLNLDGTQVTDLSPLKGMPLTDLYLGTQVTDLSPLKGMPLPSLDLRGTKVVDLAPLKGLPFLAVLNISETQVSDLSPLKGTSLVSLNCCRSKVTDLSPLKETKLKELTCDFKPERDVEILRSIKTLERLNGNPVKEYWK